MKKRKKAWKKPFSACLALITAVGMLPINSVQVQAFSGFTALASGSYMGSAQGYGGALSLQVTVDMEGNVSGIQVTDHEETELYYNHGAQVIDQIIRQQSVEVDAVTGATYTSNAIKKAVKDALNKALIGFAGGTGTKEDPYLISSKEGLNYLREQVAAGTDYAGKYLRLTNAITLTENWTPIGTQQHPFAGTFYGNGKTIKGLTITGDHAYAGLFGYAAAEAAFYDVTLENVTITTNTSSTSAAYAGALVAYLKNDASGQASAVIDHCSASGTIQATAAGAAMVGGLIGMSNQYAAITNNTSSVEVSADCGSKLGNVGGLIGMMGIKALLMNNSVSGTVSLQSENSNANVGGLTGSLNGISYNNVVSSMVTGISGREHVGGLAGNQTSASYTACNYYAAAGAFGVTSGQMEQSTVLQMKETELKEEAFVLMLHNNLKPSELEKAGEAVAAANVPGCTDFSAMMERVSGQFYDWEFNALQQAVPGGEIWTSTEYDDSIFASGTGTKEDPYFLETETQLREFATSLSRAIDYSGKYIKLRNNIIVTQDTDWTPIGEGEYAFQGDFDGAGYSVSGIKIGTEKQPYQDNGQTYYGLFGVVGRNAKVEKLTVDASIYVQSNASVYVGGLAGYIERSRIDSVTVNGMIWGRSGMEKTSVNHFSGGLAGMSLRATITNCISNADVYGEASAGIAEAGGILGLNNRSLTANCLSTGTIRGTANRKLEGMAALGGIAGVHAGTMVNCIATGDTNSETYSQYVGALSGWTTGIGELYHNFYNKDSNQTIEATKVNPVVSIGWLVGPGVNDEGEAYTGGVEYESIGLSAEEIASNELAVKLNAAFSAFPVDMKAYSGVSLSEWEPCNGQVLPVGQVVEVTYEKPELPVVSKPITAHTGTYYGRSLDQSLIVKLDVEQGIIKDANVVSNTTGVDVSMLLASVVERNSTDGITGEDAISEAVKSAADTAINRINKNDTTSYGKADPAIFAGGKGTKLAPYEIKTAKQLSAFAAAINEDESFEGSYIVLTADITLSGQWMPAGTDSHYPFKGTFNGNGYAISGLAIGTKEEPADMQYAGLFAYLEGGTVTNLTLKAPYIHIKKTGSERIYVGALAAFTDQQSLGGYIDKCQVISGTIVAQSASGAAYAGGLLGSSQYGTVTNCMVDADVSVSSTGAWCYGGVMASMFARTGVLNNRVTGTVAADASLNKAAVGGLSGFHSGVSYNNVASVTLSSKESTGDVGALAGRNTGIGMMLTGYFDQEKTQKRGNDVLAPVGVGTIVSGELDGKGVVEGLTGLTSEQLGSQETIDSLNQNGTNKKTLERIQTLLKTAWNVTLSDTISLSKWTIEETMPSLIYQKEEQAPETDVETPGAETETPATQKPGTNLEPQKPSTETTPKPSTEPQKPSTNTQKPDTSQPVTIKKAVSTGYQSVKLTWNQIKGATGYEVYRATGKNATYKKIKTITNAKTISYSDKKLTTGKTYYYKVRAVYKTASKTFYGKKSKAKSVKPVPATVKVSVKNKASRKAVVKWQKVSGATGYVVYRSISKTGTYKAVKTINSGKTVSLTEKKLKANKTYYYKVRAYRTVKGKKVYGSNSKIQSVKIKK